MAFDTKIGNSIFPTPIDPQRKAGGQDGYQAKYEMNRLKKLNFIT